MTTESTEIAGKDGEECISKRPWSEVLNRSLKLFAFNFAREGCRSFGRVVFYVILALLGLFLATLAINSVTGWFTGWFEFLPFIGSDKSAQAEEAAWYCKWNPIC